MMENMTDEPLIWTSKGNLPVSSLGHTVEWDVQDDHIRFSEIYTLDGEVVKQSQHNYLPKGLQSTAEQGTF